jgi:uncharacterized protein (TIGR00369 family)
LEFVRAFVAGDLPSPPFREPLGIRIVAAEPSSAALEFEPEGEMYSPSGSVHGGIVTVLLDAAMGTSFPTTGPAGVGYTPLELKANFLRAATSRPGVSGAEGHVIRVATAEAKLTDRERRLHTHATSTLVVLPPPREPAVDRTSPVADGD